MLLLLAVHLVRVPCATMSSSMRGRAARLLYTAVNRTVAPATVPSTLNASAIYGLNSRCCVLPVASHNRTRWVQYEQSRELSSCSRVLQQVQEPEVLPHPDTLDDHHLINMFSDIKDELKSHLEIYEIAKYYFDGQGKAVRPMITLLMSRSINTHLHDHARLFNSQREVAKVAEMIHTASLVHDDVLDASDTRRGKPSVNSLYGQRKAVMAGDYILSVASTMLARIRNEEAIVMLSQVLSDLVQGEFMQLGSKENENERFAHYLKKTFKKTASLLAYSCKAVALLSGGDESIQEVAFQYGRNVGIAFQLVDDLLDFVSSSNMMGKPTATDLKLGLATAPVLFACEKFPELNPMIMRRFQEPGDVHKAFEFVHKSDGLEQTQFLARQHCEEAIRVISSLKPSSEQKALITLTDKVLNRMK